MKKKDELTYKMINSLLKMLNKFNFERLYIPVTVNKETLLKQGYPLKESFKYTEELYLSGSSEQGILERFQGEEVKSNYYYSITPCFRVEEDYNEDRLKEFLKVELFSFSNGLKESLQAFNDLLNIPHSTFYHYNKDHEIVYKDVTKDEGYHLLKIDTLLKRKDGSTLELGSCTLWGEEQTKRFNITGATYTVSQTGLAFPRALRVNETYEEYQERKRKGER